MALALYRKYRPQTFKEITDQNHVKITLEREVATSKVAHAYLFSGPRGTGKTSMARILAKAVNCEKRKDGSGEPCGKCRACPEITAGRSLDVLEIDAASYTGVDTVRETIIETAKFAPSRLKFKVFIIDEVQMLSTSAWSALLKIMEEPPAHVIFILATTEVHKVPATILSRCQRFDFHRVKPHDIVLRLQFIAREEKIQIAKPVLETVARLAEGCVRDAESLLEQLCALGEKEITVEEASLVLPRTALPLALEVLECVCRQEAARGLESVSRLLDEGVDLNQFTHDLLELLRRMLLFKFASTETAFGALDEISISRIAQLSESTPVPRILELIDIFVRAKQALKGASIPQLPLEVAVVEGCGVGEARPAGGDSAIQGSSFARPVKAGLAADAPKIAPPHRQSAPLGVKKGVALSLDAIKSKWPEVLKRVQAENHSLPFLLSTSEPLAVEQGIIRIGVRYPFHRDKLNEPKCRVVLEKIVQELYQAPLGIESVIAVPHAPDNTVENIINTLGGRIVE